MHWRYFAKEIDFFHADEMKLLTELTGDIGFAIDYIQKIRLSSDGSHIAYRWPDDSNSKDTIINDGKNINMDCYVGSGF